MDFYAHGFVVVDTPEFIFRYRSWRGLSGSVDFASAVLCDRSRRLDFKNKRTDKYHKLYRNQLSVILANLYEVNSIQELFW